MMDAGSVADLVSGNALADGRAKAGLQKLRALTSAAQGTEAARTRALRKAAVDFEAVFLGQMLAPMFAGLKTDGPFGGGHAESVFRSMMVDEMGTTIARSGGVGLADAVYRQLLSLQEM